MRIGWCRAKGGWQDHRAKCNCKFPKAADCVSHLRGKTLGKSFVRRIGGHVDKLADMIPDQAQNYWISKGRANRNWGIHPGKWRYRSKSPPCKDASTEIICRSIHPMLPIIATSRGSNGCGCWPCLSVFHQLRYEIHSPNQKRVWLPSILKIDRPTVSYPFAAVDAPEGVCPVDFIMKRKRWRCEQTRTLGKNNHARTWYTEILYSVLSTYRAHTEYSQLLCLWNSPLKKYPGSWSLASLFVCIFLVFYPR